MNTSSFQIISLNTSIFQIIFLKTLAGNLCGKSHMLLRQVSFHGHLESYAGLQSFTEHRQLQIREDRVNIFFF